MSEIQINQAFIESLVTRFRLIGFDADHTIWEPRIGQGRDSAFRQTPADVRWMEGRKEVLRKLYNLGVRIFIATNQGFTPFLPTEERAEQFIKEHLQVSETLAAEIGPHVKVYHCFTYPPKEGTRLEQYVKENDFMRKPNPGMLFTAMSDVDISNVLDVLYVGDMDSDREAARNADVAFYGAEAFFSKAYQQ